MRGEALYCSVSPHPGICGRIKLVPGFPSTGTTFALTWIAGRPTEPSVQKGKLGAETLVLGPLPVGLGSASGLTRSWDPSYRPEAPSAAAAPSGRVPGPPRRGCPAGGGGPPRRDAKQPPGHRAHLTLSTLRAPRISEGHAGRASWPGSPAGDCAGQRRRSAPAPRRGPAPSLRPSLCLRPPPSPGRQVQAPSPLGSCSGRALSR